ncbi:MAG: 30S ribosomal protein S27ae [archaeon]|nr:30S ribosomal protein S27ae [archaeon]
MAEKKESKGKKAHTKHPTMKKGTYYKVEGNSLKRKKTCPKCGSGVFMAEHSNRRHCGKCGFTEFK